MNWDISRQNACTLRVIFLLYMRADSGRSPKSRAEIIAIIKDKGFSEDRVGYSLNSLLDIELVYKGGGEGEGEGVYRLTSTGVHWVEFNFHIENVGDKYTFTPKRDKITIGKEGAFPQSQVKGDASTDIGSVNWGKWGALASIIAIPIAILIWLLS